MLSPSRFIVFTSLALAASHPAAAQTYTAGAGLTLTGNTFSIAAGGVTGSMIGLPLALTASSSNPILTVTNTGSGYGLKTVSTTGTGTYGTNAKYGNVGTLGDINGFGVYGSTAAGPYPYGVFGINRASGNGDYGILGGVEPVTGNKNPVGMFGSDTSSAGYAVFGNSTNGLGIFGNSTGAYGILGLSSSSGIDGNGKSSGVVGLSGSGIGVRGDSSSGTGLSGSSTSSYGVSGVSASSDGVRGTSSGSGGMGVYGSNTGSGDSGFLGGISPVTSHPVGVFGDDAYTDSSGNAGTGVGGRSTGTNGYGVFGYSSGMGSTGVFGYSRGTDGKGVYGIGEGTGGYGGYFQGNVEVTGTLTAGTKDFKIDHPLDPQDKYLYHASVESDQMTDVYSGNVTTDSRGSATVTLPNWFQALNTDFRYQLTAIGQFSQAIVGSKVKNNQFTIKTDKPSVEVSWQITGVRHDAFALAHPLQVEQDKPENEKGLYQNPEAFGQPESMGLESSGVRGIKP